MYRLLRKVNNRVGVVASLLLVSLLSACTNSHIVVSTLYDRLDNQIRNEFNKLGKFDQAQKAEFETILQTFHLWHRRSELPEYAQVLRDIRSSVMVKNNTTAEEVTDWHKQVEDFANRAQACYPVHFAVDMMTTLRDDQIDFIENRFQRERNRNRTKYNSRSREERHQKRVETISTWASRAGLELTRRQKRMFLAAMKESNSLRKEYYALTDAWNQKTFQIVRARQKPSFALEMSNQLDSLFSLMEKNYPSEIAANRVIWRKFTLDFVNSMTNNQRVWAAAWLKKMAKNLDRISDKEVKFKAHRNPVLGCLPENKT